jgi:hypothetical protein
MRFYTKVHEAYCGIDLHARTMDCLHLKSVFEKSPESWCESPYHQTNHGDLDEIFTRLDLALVIFAEPTRPINPGQGPFHDPAPGPDGEPLPLRRALDNFQLPVPFRLAPRGECFPAVGTVGPNPFQAGVERLQACKQPSCASTIWRIRWGHIHRYQQPQRVHQQMALSRFDLFVPIIALNRTGLHRGLHALAIHDRRRRQEISVRMGADCTAQRFVHQMPHAGLLPSSEVMIHRLPRRMIPGEEAPSTPSAQDIENGVQDVA